MKRKYNCSKNIVYEANIKIHNLDLAFGTFGNVSGRNANHCLIKASGVEKNHLSINNIVKVDLRSSAYTGQYKPSTDTPTHIEIYNSYSEIGGICHVHSKFATAWAQAGMAIPCLGTSHADYWNGEIPITRELTFDEINGQYEKETGRVIIEKILELGLKPIDIPGILVWKHGPFTWGKTIGEAVKNANILENIARMAWLTLTINPNTESIPSVLRKQHFERKQGPNSYYGQDSD